MWKRVVRSLVDVVDPPAGGRLRWLLTVMHLPFVFWGDWPNLDHAIDEPAGHNVYRSAGCTGLGGGMPGSSTMSG